MTALAMDVLQEVSEAGGTVRLEGEMLRLWAPEPLPDELRARLHQHKAEIVALLSAAEPANDATPRVRPCRASPACRRRSPTASTPWSRLTELRGYRHSAGHGCNAMLHGWSKAAGCSGPSPSAGPPPTCSAATNKHRGTGSTAPASSC